MSNRNLTLSGIVSVGVFVAAASVSNAGDDLSQGVPAVTQTQFMTLPDDMRDYRYCEIIPVFRNGLNIHAEVYNTLKLNQCPADLWSELDEEPLENEYGAITVIMNGPRHWVVNELDGMGATADARTVDFGGIEMTWRAALDTKIWNGSVFDSPYTANEIQRNTIYTYHAGNMVYELTSPDGDVYRMQAYPQIADPTLTIEDLESLGERLAMPNGWSYQARILAENSELKADGLATILTDELNNTYQKVTP